MREALAWPEVGAPLAQPAGLRRCLFDQGTLRGNRLKDRLLIDLLAATRPLHPQRRLLLPQCDGRAPRVARRCHQIGPVQLDEDPLQIPRIVLDENLVGAPADPGRKAVRPVADVVEVDAGSPQHARLERQEIDQEAERIAHLPRRAP